MRLVLSLVATAACTATNDSRDARILDSLAEDNYMWARRDPELVRMKLLKMQRGPYEWLRGTAALYWQDATEPGAAQAVSTFTDGPSSRVLLLGDPHVENVGTFRAADGTMFMDWNDFDATGYGPFGGDLRRLGASLVVVAGLGAPGDAALPEELVRRAAQSYVELIGELSAGSRIGTIGLGTHELFDDELERAQSRGNTRFAIDEVAPVVDGVRVLAFGDLETVAEDGVLEDRLLPVDEEQAAWLDRAIVVWGATRPLGGVKLRARRIGSGVASYAAYRYNVVLEGPSGSVDDDIVLELKETRDGVVIRGVPRLQAAAWSTPAARSVITQLQLQARPDADGLLGYAQVGALSLKFRDREAYQRGMDAGDIADLAVDDRDAMLALAGHYGALLARAHGQAPTADQLAGHLVIAPLLAGREAAFVDEIAALSAADAAQTLADFESMKDRDLAAFVVPGVP